jgi:hypothetical protein
MATYCYPCNHTQQDTPDKLSYGEFARMMNGHLKTLLLLANDTL